MPNDSIKDLLRRNDILNSIESNRHEVSIKV